jgi:hypothetical protein
MNEKGSSAEDSPGRSSAPTRIRSVGRAASCCCGSRVSDGVTAKEIAKAHGLALPTTYHLLNTLVDEGLLAPNPRQSAAIAALSGTSA